LIDTPEEFCDVLERSQLLGESELEAVRALLQRPTQPSPMNLAQWLVKHGHVTVWQAERLLGGSSQFFLAGTYKFIDQISEGAMGVVFKAEHAVMRRTVAVKVLSKARLSHPNAVARFRREVEAMATLDHPNIVRAYDAGQIGKTYYLVMEFIDGSDLNAWSEKYERLPIRWACEFIRQAAMGLDHAHQLGMVHRDIKPANIMVMWNDDERRPVVKILDLGLARAITDEEDLHYDPSDSSFTHASESQLTQSGTIVGTPDYLAPEQIMGGEVDARTDIFSLGCTLFKLLTGHLPYTGPDLLGKLQARVAPTAPPAVRLRTLLPEASEDLEAILAKMLERDPEKRYKTAAEVALALAPYADAPREKWTELCPSKAPARDSSEVGSSQMQADARLRDFFGGLAGDPKPGATMEELPTIRGEARSLTRDSRSGSSPAVGDSQSVLDSEPDPSGSSVLLAKYRQHRARQKLYGAAILFLTLIAVSVAFWRIVLNPDASSSSVPPWPGDQHDLVFAWQSAGAGQEDQATGRFFSGVPGLAANLVWDRKGLARIDETGWLDLRQDGAFRLPGAEGPLVEACQRSQAFSLELVLAAADLWQYAARVATFSSGDKVRNFTLGQQARDYVFQLHTSESGEDDPQCQACRIPDAARQHLIVSFRPGRLVAYLNGKPSSERTDLQGDLSAWHHGELKLLLGNEASGQRPWRGRIERVAAYSRFIDAAEAEQRHAMVGK
jgi:serine/threonine protein kinase